MTTPAMISTFLVDLGCKGNFHFLLVIKTEIELEYINFMN
jgi:hypothetical protein